MNPYIEALFEGRKVSFNRMMNGSGYFQMETHNNKSMVVFKSLDGFTSQPAKLNINEFLDSSLNWEILPIEDPVISAANLL